jgi:hypothetical protein
MVMVECNETKNNKNICKYLNNKKHKYNIFLNKYFKNNATTLFSHKIVGK